MSEAHGWPRDLASLIPEEVLKEARAPIGDDASFKHLYLLGCLNRHVTVYSQQIRALNLVHVLNAKEDTVQGKKGVLNGKKIAIVGAGISGLTAAVYAAQLGASITVFEQAHRPLWLQDGCRNRWLHPRIYDWPVEGSLDPRTDLPVLNWRASSAQDVARQIREQWEYSRSEQANIQPPRYGHQVTKVTQAPESKPLRLHWIEPSKDQEADAPPSDSDHEDFDYVILAVGFGIEKNDPGEVGIYSYWSDNDGLDQLAPDATVLISGYGDGGLADLMRLCLHDFRQDELLNLVRNIDPAMREKLLDWDNAFSGNDERLHEKYIELTQPEYRSLLPASFKGSIRKDVIVTITGRPQDYLYGKTSAILNRFIVSQIYKYRPFEILKEKVDSVKKKGAQFEVIFADGKKIRAFDHVILRHGPKSSLLQFEPTLDPREERKTRWRALPQSLDKTRVALDWQTNPPPEDSPEDDPLALLESYESVSDFWCLVLHPPNPKLDWKTLTQTALKERAKDIKNELRRSITLKPLVVPVDKALATARTYRRLVRALCEADIVLADVTGYDPAVMMLLGIRSVVKRGITITCINTQGQEDQEVWENVPFNLREINLIILKHHQATINKQLGDAIFEGLKTLGRTLHYLDLPTYEYVRYLGDKSDDYKEIPEKKRVLFLRSFNPLYEGRNWIFVCQSFKQLLEDRVPALTPALESILDEDSPQLMSQRLYEAIRRTRFCVVDWTLWRPNVFYEFGVRLAASDVGPISLIGPTPLKEETPEASTHKALRALFKPFEYTLNVENREPFEKALKAFFTITDDDAGANGLSKNDSLNHDETYHEARKYYKIQQEKFISPVEEDLEASVEAAIGGEDPDNPDPTQLYGRRNGRFMARIRTGALERLCAAWSYLDSREAPYTYAFLDLLDPEKRRIFTNYQALYSKLEKSLRKLRSERDKRMRDLIRKRKREMTETRKFLEQLESWESVKSALSRNVVDSLPAFREEDVKKLLKKLKQCKTVSAKMIRDEVEATLDSLPPRNPS